MAVGVSSNTSQGRLGQPLSLDSTFTKFQAEVARESVNNMIKKNTSRVSSFAEEDSLESLLAPDSRGRLQFGDPKKNSKRTTRALFAISNLVEAARRLETKIQSISTSHTPEEIQATLCAVEDGSETLNLQIASITRTAVSEEVKEAREILESLNQMVCAWRLEYPDSSPVKINNRKHFFDPGEGKNTPTIIAYCIALVSRVFEGTAQRGASLILKLLKIFGFSFATLGGQELNPDQEAVLAMVPESIETLEQKFNLNIKCISYAVCPKCSFTHPPSYPNDATHPVYPTVCSERRAPLEEPCGALLLSYGKPLKRYEYYPFFDWFGRFLALPGIEEYGNKFCDTVSSHQSIPSDKVDQTDGRFVHEFRAQDGKLFVADRGNEGRWFFTLNADFFNVEGNRIRGKKSSTGMIAMSCLNLPLEIRNDHAFLYIPGIIRGPHEPNASNAEHRHYLKPLVDDLVKGYTRGVRPFATFRTRDSNTPYSQVSRIALVLALMDFKAARPFCGLLDVTSHHFCFLCDCWHTAHLGRTDYENWTTLDDERLRKGAEMWREAMLKDRKAIEELFGTRFSELWRLPYWRLCQIGIDPMHAFFLILLQRMFRDILGLDNPEDPSRKPSKPRFKIAFYYDFTPPPSLSSLVQEMAEVPLRRWSSMIGYVSQPLDEHRLSLLDWDHLSSEHRTHRRLRLESLKVEILNDSRAYQGVLEILTDLCERAPEVESKKKALYGRIQKQKWNAILYVCDNLAIFPDHRCPQFQTSSKILKTNAKKEFLTNILINWRTNDIREMQGFVWPYFTPIDMPPPITPWAPTHPSNGTGNTHMGTRALAPGERLELLKELGKSMNYSSASGVGNIHRLLQQPLSRGEQEDELRKVLRKLPGNSLAYVCTDIERLPTGKFAKDDMVKQLMDWRMMKPLDQMKSAIIDSPGLLRRVQQVVREVVTPAWVTNPPSNVGLYEAGTLKADNWRTLFSIHMPLAILSLWKESSPLAAANASDMTSVMDTVMHLACASLIMTKRKLSLTRRDDFRRLLRLHILGLKENFPGWIFPTHHLAFHIHEFMDLFSGVRHWWLFPFEKLIGKLQRTPTNHKPGEFEHTLLHSFCTGAFFRQWMMRPNAPPFLRYCQKLIDKAYNYDHRPSDHSASNAPDQSSVTPELIASNFTLTPKTTIASVPELTNLLGTEPFESFSRIPASKGDYTIPIEGALGNSYICFHPEGDHHPGQQWSAGQIQHIFRRKNNGPIQLAVLQSQSVHVEDPFSDFWGNGFEAKLVSSKFVDILKVIEMKQVAAHTARWAISNELVVVVNLCSVRRTVEPC
ncbi:uncharacterized protein C8R40DRAFT_1167781 [Lentinula edodes]|uniref:uncharacterized protein n=1 Tax=Lentinula edodes TaxID=5353 RepID=UPI001E8E72CB|nr:uncharacterized protein C8R40DRAFT_1167781 [Lentinula edodes]KAH7878355.1 hypothetical protein C8R40DRAFT_1167781 [Lentinula edodes]